MPEPGAESEAPGLLPRELSFLGAEGLPFGVPPFVGLNVGVGNGVPFWFGDTEGAGFTGGASSFDFVCT